MSRTHSVPQASFDGLAAGDGSAATVATLRAAQLSKRMLLVHAIVDLAARTQPLACAAAGLPQGYDLLARLQRRSPSAVEAVLLHPQVGVWGAHCLRRLLRPGPATVPLGTDLGHLGAIAAAAAIRSGVDFEVAVAVRRGTVMLPTLGLAVLGTGELNKMAVVRRGHLRVEITTGTTALALPADLGVEVTGWLPLRRLEASADGRRVEVFLDDLDPFRDCYQLPVAPRLDGRAVEEWQRVLDQAWSLLARHHPGHAEAIPAGLASIVPLDTLGQAGSASATSRDAFGAVASTPPADGLRLAAALVHELQHSKLNALLDLFPLYRAGDQRLYYAPWRNDPRPLSGLLHGTYAYLGVTDFWRVQRQVTTGDHAALADFEFARWREPAWQAARRLARSGCLTELGRRFVGRMQQSFDRWRDLPVAAGPLALARDASVDHRVSWRLHNLRPAAGVVERLALAWAAGARCPGMGRPAIAVVTAGRWPDGARTRLLYLRVTDTTRFHQLARDRAALEGEVVDATGADLAYVRGDYAEAARSYRAEIADDPDRPESWAGLALARARVGAGPVAKVMLSFPEVVYAVHHEVRALTGMTPDPDSLSSWLATSSPAAQGPPGVG